MICCHQTSGMRSSHQKTATIYTQKESKFIIIADQGVRPATEIITPGKGEQTTVDTTICASIATSAIRSESTEPRGLRNHPRWKGKRKEEWLGTGHSSKDEGPRASVGVERDRSTDDQEGKKKANGKNPKGKKTGRRRNRKKEMGKRVRQSEISIWPAESKTKTTKCLSAWGGHLAKCIQSRP